MRLTARLNRTSMALGRTATISGQVAPAHRGQQIRLQQQRGRTWHTAQKKTLPASGRYSLALRPEATGTSWWRFYKASDTDHIGAISAVLPLVVYRAAITGIRAASPSAATATEPTPAAPTIASISCRISGRPVRGQPRVSQNRQRFFNSRAGPGGDGSAAPDQGIIPADFHDSTAPAHFVAGTDEPKVSAAQPARHR